MVPRRRRWALPAARVLLGALARRQLVCEGPEVAPAATSRARRLQGGRLSPWGVGPLVGPGASSAACGRYRAHQSGHKNLEQDGRQRELLCQPVRNCALAEGLQAKLPTASIAGSSAAPQCAATMAVRLSFSPHHNWGAARQQAQSGAVTCELG